MQKTSKAPTGTPTWYGTTRRSHLKLQGQVYYQINEALYPSENENPQYGQLFIVDPQEAVDYRMAANLGSGREIMNNLNQMLGGCNIFAK